MIVSDNLKDKKGLINPMSNEDNDLKILNNINMIKSDLISPDQHLEMIENLILKNDLKLLSEIFSYLYDKYADDTKYKLILQYYQIKTLIIEKKKEIAIQKIDQGIASLISLSEVDKNSKNLLHMYYIERHYCLVLQGEYEVPLNFYRNLLELNYPDLSEKLKFILTNLIASINLDLGYYEKSIEYYNNALQIAQNYTLSKNLPILLNQIGKAHFLVNKTEVSLETLKLSFNASENTNNNYFICKNIVDIAIILHIQNQLEEDKFFQTQYQKYRQILQKYEILNEILNLILTKDYDNHELKFLKILEKKDKFLYDDYYKIIFVELLIEKIIRNLRSGPLSPTLLDNLLSKIILMEKIATENFLIKSNFKAKMLKGKFYLINGSFQETKDVLLDILKTSKNLKLHKFTKLIELEYQRIQMNSILYGKIDSRGLIASSFSKQHLNELFHFLFNFDYYLNKQ